MSLFDRFLTSAIGEVEVQSRALWRDDFNYDGPAQATSNLRTYNKLPAVKKHVAITEELSEEMAYLSEWDTCTHCSFRYQRLHNLGTHKCCFHPDPSTHPTTYRCCGANKLAPGMLARGCQPCDHTPFNAAQVQKRKPRWTPDNVFTRVPKAARILFPFPDSSIVQEENNPHESVKSFLLITRVQNYTLNDV